MEMSVEAAIADEVDGEVDEEVAIFIFPVSII